MQRIVSPRKMVEA